MDGCKGGRLDACVGKKRRVSISFPLILLLPCMSTRHDPTMKLYLDEYSTCLRIHSYGITVDVTEGALLSFVSLSLCGWMWVGVCVCVCAYVTITHKLDHTEPFSSLL